MFIDHVNNAWHHGERNNSKDDGEGLAGPTDGLIQRPLLIQEARIIEPHVGDGIVVCLFANGSSRREPVLVKETEVVARVLLCLPECRIWRCW